MTAETLAALKIARESLCWREMASDDCDIGRNKPCRAIADALAAEAREQVAMLQTAAVHYVRFEGDAAVLEHLAGLLGPGE